MSNELYHFGIKGMKWGVRRFQNPDGSLTEVGRKRAAKSLSKEYKKGYDSSNPFRTSDKFNETAKDIVRKGISKADLENVKSAKKKFLDTTKEAIDAEDKLNDEARKIGIELFKKELKRNPSAYPDERSKQKATDYYIYDEGFDLARKRNPELTKKEKTSSKAYDMYKEECKKAADSILGSYGETKLYECKYYSYKMRDAVADAINSMDSQNELDRIVGK